MNSDKEKEMFRIVYKDHILPLAYHLEDIKEDIDVLYDKMENIKEFINDHIIDINANNKADELFEDFKNGLEESKEI
jgi:hypothetical protein